MNDLLFLKIGSKFDWIEVDVEDESGAEYMETVIEPFLDMAVSVKGNEKLGRTKFQCEDNSGKSYFVTVKDLVNNAGLKVYYHDADTQPNLTPFIDSRAEGMLQSLLEEIDVFVLKHSNKEAA